jgi:hypothetical protein
MKKMFSVLGGAIAVGFLVAPGSCLAYDSGSTGADGAFNPTVSQTLQLPPDGVLNFTTVNIPTGVTITFKKNAANTPVTILASGNVTVAGTINVSAAGTPTPADVASAGVGGPGGYDGGRGGQQAGLVSGWVNGYGGLNVGKAGFGPGGGGPGNVLKPHPYGYQAGALAGGCASYYGSSPGDGNNYGNPGATYGNAALIPLIGGSGGGGGAGGALLPGSGGGGGGGAILIASSGTLNVTGSILANGGAPTDPGPNTSRGAPGGPGSGGAIRLIATTVTGNGAISAAGGGVVYGTTTYDTNYVYYVAGSPVVGGVGRIRIEAENIGRTAATNPAWIASLPQPVSVPGLPTLRIDSIVTNLGTITIPQNPTGRDDVTIPVGYTNPVTANFVTTGIPPGSTIKLSVIPAQGPAYFTVNSAVTTGTTANATGSLAFNLPSGSIAVQASVTYTVVASVGDAMSVYAQGERVEKVTLASTLGSKENQVILTTVSGKEYKAPVSVLALAASQG